MERAKPPRSARSRRANSVAGVLPCAAAQAYGLLCDVPLQPQWLPILSYAIPLKRRRTGPTRVAYLLRLVRGSVGFSVQVTRRTKELKIRFERPKTAEPVSAGVCSPSTSVRFVLAGKVVPLDEKSCLLRLTLELDLGRGLPPLDRPDFAVAPAHIAFEAIRRLLIAPAVEASV